MIMTHTRIYIQRCIIFGIIFLLFSGSVCIADPPSIIQKSINASGYCPVNDFDPYPFPNIFVNIPVVAMGSIPTEDSQNSSYHVYTFNQSEYHFAGESIRSVYGVTLQPLWSGIFMLLGGGADGWTAEETDFSAFSTLSFWAKAASNSQNPIRLKVEILDNDGKNNILINTLTTSWQKYSISLTSLLGLNRARIKQLNIIYEQHVIDAAGGMFDGVVYFDQFEME